MTRRPPGTGSLSLRKDGMWIGRVDVGWTPQGTRRRLTVSSKKKAEAARKLRDLQRRINEGQVAAVGTGTRVTVKAWSETWLPLHAAKVRPTTYATDAGAIRKWIIPTIGHRRLADLTPADLRGLRAAITGAGRSTTTALHAHKILIKLLRDAIVEGHSVPQRVMEAPKPGKAANDRAALPTNQLLAILNVVGTRDDAARWLAAILNGVRQGEALGLRWQDLDLDTGVMTVRWQLQRLPDDHARPDEWDEVHLTGHFYLTPTKTSKGVRVIPLVPWLVQRLRVEQAAWAGNPWGLVWTTEGLPIRDEDDRATWRAIQAEAGAAHPSGRPWHVHECRHAAASLLKRAGTSDQVIAAILGQAVLVDSYVHTDLADARRALDRVANVLELEG